MIERIVQIPFLKYKVRSKTRGLNKFSGSIIVKSLACTTLSLVVEILSGLWRSWDAVLLY
jgi:hypothetical protein